MSVADAICIAWCAFLWGDWWGARKAEKLEPQTSAFKLLYGMTTEILEKRRFVGSGMMITREERFEFKGERFVLSLCSEGSPVTIDGELA
jgi:hypothetical protein